MYVWISFAICLDINKEKRLRCVSWLKSNYDLVDMLILIRIVIGYFIEAYIQSGVRAVYILLGYAKGIPVSISRRRVHFPWDRISFVREVMSNDPLGFAETMFHKT